MAPIAIDEVAIEHKINVADLKAKVRVKDVELQLPSYHPPVADDYMYDFKYNHALPTSDVLGITIPDDCDAQTEAEAIVAHLSEVMGQGHGEKFANLFLEYGKFDHIHYVYGVTE